MWRIVSSTRSGTVANVHSGSSAIMRRIARRSAAGLATTTLDGDDGSRSVCTVGMSLPSTTAVGSDLAGDTRADCTLELDDVNGPRFEGGLLVDCADFILPGLAMWQQSSHRDVVQCNQQTVWNIDNNRPPKKTLLFINAQSSKTSLLWHFLASSLDRFEPQSVKCLCVSVHTDHSTRSPCC